MSRALAPTMASGKTEASSSPLISEEEIGLLQETAIFNFVLERETITDVNSDWWSEREVEREIRVSLFITVELKISR